MANPMCMPGFRGFDCSLIWLVWIFTFFITAVLRKQVNDNLGTPFSLIGGTVLGIGLSIGLLYVPWIGGVKLSVLGAIIGIIAGGFGGALIGLPDTETND